MPKNFLIRLLAILAIGATLFVAGAYLAKNQLEAYYIPILPWLLLYVMVVNIAANFFKLRSAEKDPLTFPRHLMAINGIRIFAYLIFIVIYVFLKQETARDFLIAFMALYFIFFVFDLATSKK